MPGIAVIFGRTGAEDCGSLVPAMLQTMQHEPFYRTGTYFAPGIGVYAGWVAHESSASAGQVTLNDTEDLAIILSGECFLDENSATKNNGATQGSVSIGERILRDYAANGEGCLKRLNGLFSGLIIDKKKSRAILFNDRYGVERLYQAQTKYGLLFASEAKAVLKVAPDTRAFDRRGLGEMLAFGATLKGRTLFRGINLLPGGSAWTYEDGVCCESRYFAPSEWETQPTLNVEDFNAKFDETFRRIVPRYFNGGSGVGISLTGGLDTRMIMAAGPMDRGMPCYTFVGRGKCTRDAQIAAAVAQSCNLGHRSLQIDGDFFADFTRQAEKTVYVTDGCAGVTAAHEIYLNKKARELAPVRMTGNFGSEILRSMSTFKRSGLAPDLVRKDFIAVEEPGGAGWQSEHPVTFAAFQEIPWSLFGTLAAARSQVVFRTPYLDNEIVELAYQAPVSARSSSSAALHFLQKNNRALAEIPTDRGVVAGGSNLVGALRRMASYLTFKLDYYYNDGMPQWLARWAAGLGRIGEVTGLLGQHKYLHYRTWFRNELAEFVQEQLSAAAAGPCEMWDRESLHRIAREHLAGRGTYTREINAVITLEMVRRQFSLAGVE